MERKTKIIATLGPASNKKEVFEKMIPYVDMVRLNFSWGDKTSMKDTIEMVKEVCESYGKKVFIIQDLSGPRVQGDDGHHFDQTSINTVTEKDKDDLLFGINNDIDFVAMSYVGSADDIRMLRDIMKNLGKEIKIIAKIERREAVDNITEIIDVSDGIMIARGDLGQAFPIEEIPHIEKNILSLCKEKNKFVIVATEVMLSMVTKERPTRAEVTDIEYAVSEGASAIMLSEETAEGEHPDKVVEILDEIIGYSENNKVLL